MYTEAPLGTEITKLDESEYVPNPSANSGKYRCVFTVEIAYDKSE